ncbi:XPA protein C-terminus-domain-containing protein [Apiospora phragmitis]|uniref:XPA protein C-terminus-domain-containing protein n=1 Tax=Apiospora phragmitis TaxID=2905665 RepID=A0ABR1WVW7_9PEZI
MPRPSTPPRAPDPSKAAVSPPTPAVTRRIEENRLRAKAIREANEKAGAPPLSRTRSGFVAADDVQVPNTRKRTHDAISSSSAPVRNLPATSRDGRINGATDAAAAGAGAATKSSNSKEDDGAIRPARKFTKFVDYDFDKITDTKGGFLSTEDDPWNKAMSGSATANGSKKPGQPEPEERPKGMTTAEWERLQILKKLRRQKAGPFEPGLSVLKDASERKKCRECGSLEIDFVWEEVFGCAVCGRCKEAMPEKYSLLTKTECKDDYLLTDRDEELLPHLSRPNPHKSHWHDMMLFLRYQVEEYAFSDKRWGSPRREADKKKRKEAKFKSKLLDLKKRTRTDAYRREHGKLGGGGGGTSSSTSGGGAGGAGGKGKARFDDVIGGGKHVHEWGRAIENEAGMTVKTCTTCGMEVEELEF